MAGDILFSDELIRVSAADAADSFFDEAGVEIVAASAELATRGDTQAFFVPAVRLMLDTSLGARTSPVTEQQLPLEICSRRQIATRLAGNISDIFSRGRIEELYRHHPLLGRLPVGDDAYRSLSDHNYMKSLVQAPLSDTSAVSGGALRLLQREGFETTPAEVIRRSSGLLAVSGIHKAHHHKAEKFLGDPYTRRHLLLVEGEKGKERVNFTQNARNILGTFYVEGRGCPAGRIENPSTGNNLLTGYWTQIVDFMVPEGATAVAG